VGGGRKKKNGLARRAGEAWCKTAWGKEKRHPLPGRRIPRRRGGAGSSRNNRPPRMRATDDCARRVDRRPCRSNSPHNLPACVLLSCERTRSFCQLDLQAKWLLNDVTVAKRSGEYHPLNVLPGMRPLSQCRQYNPREEGVDAA